MVTTNAGDHPGELDHSDNAASADDSAPPAYPHCRNDCDCCAEFDADMAARYPDLAGRDLRWCHRCAGQLLAQLTAHGHTVTIHPVEGAHPSQSNRTGHDDGGPQWTVEIAEQVLRRAQPGGSTFLRALIDEGGTATAERLREVLGVHELQYMTQTLTAAARKVLGRQALGWRPRIATARQDPDHPRIARVYDYTMPADLVTIFDEALRRLNR
jgi:hypothetical protein